MIYVIESKVDAKGPFTNYVIGEGECLAVDEVIFYRHFLS